MSRPLRLVYWGPADAGKTANLEFLASRLPDGAARLRRLRTEAPDAWPFEFLACDAAELGLEASVGLQLLTVPGDALAVAARRALLPGCDAVVFVADARPERLDADLVLLDELGAALAAADRVPPRTSLVLQYNRADAAEALPADLLDAALNGHHGPRVTAVATTGRGVLAALAAALAGVAVDPAAAAD